MNTEAQLGLGWTGRVMQLLNAACTLVLVNLLFAAGTLAGLGVLGIMPAGAAAASVLLRDSTTLEREGGATRVFVRAYRRSFLRANLAGIPFLAAAALLAADALVLPRLTGPAAAVLTTLTVAIALAALLTGIVVVTLLERYDDPPAALLRYAVTVTLTSPATGAGVVVALAACGLIALAVPVFAPLAGASVPLAIAVRLIDRRLAHLDPAHPNH
ncbi:YesL family protein [Microbacterium sp. YJN-G]|uniref:YesL family protein n=1 Tax=Microbacterium sp. YJN-G TaxID=2763257 RepID=UPI0018789D12|nr:DUF624 domain-containing protein [Microbacterium sp. YJN-G]